MPIRFRNRIFAPSLLATLLMLAVLAGFVSLGFWQLGRATEKQTLLAQFASGGMQTFELTVSNAMELARYQQVRATGRYAPERQILLDNMPGRSGAPGYHVLTPFELDDGGLLLVDRGWVPLGRDRATLPTIGVASMPRQIVGLIDELPRPAMRLGEPEPDTGSWPRVLNFPEHVTLKTLYGERLLRPILLLDPGAEDGFERAWEARFGFGPERHVGYAVQWFALGLTLLVIYAVVSFKKSPATSR